MTEKARPGALVVGFDAMDANLVERWCARGDMPVMASLRHRGVAGRLSTPPGLGDDSTWASLYTGVWPGRHGRYFYQTLTPGSYRTSWYDDAHLRYEPFWTRLSRQGYRLAVLDVPKSPVMMPDFNGVALSDWRVHGADHLAPSSQPPSLARHLLARWGADETDTIQSTEYLCSRMTASHVPVFMQRTHRSLQQKLEMSLEVLHQEPWHLFLTVFKEAHCAGHQLWNLHDAAHPRHRTDLPHGDPVKDVYVALDAALGRLVGEVDPATPVLVFSDLGMGANYGIGSMLEDVLLRWELTSRPTGRRRVARRGPGWESRLDGRATRAGRRAYAIESTDVAGAVRYNLKGREPDGLVAPGREAEQLGRDLEALVAGLVDDQGRPVCGPVLYSDQVFPGPHRDQLPDMLIPWAFTGPVRTVHSPTLGAFANAEAAGRPGTHRSGGFFIAAGPDLEPRHDPLAARIVDVAPTIAAWLGASLPDTDGSPMAALLPGPARRGAV